MLKVYNSLSHRKEKFQPIHPPKVGMYVCGPTIYGPSHFGHIRTYIAFDIIRRYLEYKNYQVKFVMNITDIHDDMVKKAKALNISLNKLINKYLPLFHQDLKTFNIKKAAVYPQVSKHIPEIIKFIKILIKKGFAYEQKGSVYFNISKFKNYGRLSGIKINKSKTGTRVQTDKYEKENISDFALWKAVKNQGKTKSKEPFWHSPWGPGRPGWHIECSVMSIKYLGSQIDIHGGAQDLIFPHHENEIAQSEAATGKTPFVKYWLHSGLLKINGQKMSKSLGNYIEIPELLEKHSPIAVRFFVLSKHYRSTINFTEENIKKSEKALKKLQNFILKLKEIKNNQQKKEDKIIQDKIIQTRKLFVKYMDDDFNTPKAIASIFKFIKTTNPYIQNNQINKKTAQKIRKLMMELDKVLALKLKQVKSTKTIPLNIQKLAREREKARKNKDWKQADALRQKVESQGFKIEDTPSGFRILPSK